jgi:hypothetical protein
MKICINSQLNSIFIFSILELHKYTNLVLGGIVQDTQVSLSLGIQDIIVGFSIQEFGHRSEN